MSFRGVGVLLLIRLLNITVSICILFIYADVFEDFEWLGVECGVDRVVRSE